MKMDSQKSLLPLITAIESYLDRTLDDIERGEFARLIIKFRDVPHEEMVALKCDEIILGAEYVG